MSKISLNLVRINGEFYTHFMDTKTDTTTFELGGEVLYKVDKSANLYDRAGKLGVFRMNPNENWFLTCLSGMVIETSHKNLLKAEIEVFKKLMSE